MTMGQRNPVELKIEGQHGKFLDIVDRALQEVSEAKVRRSWKR